MLLLFVFHVNSMFWIISVALIADQTCEKEPALHHDLTFVPDSWNLDPNKIKPNDCSNNLYKTVSSNINFHVKCLRKDLHKSLLRSNQLSQMLIIRRVFHFNTFASKIRHYRRPRRRLLVFALSFLLQLFQLKSRRVSSAYCADC